MKQLPTHPDDARSRIGRAYEQAKAHLGGDPKCADISAELWDRLMEITTTTGANLHPQDTLGELWEMKIKISKNLKDCEVEFS